MEETKICTKCHKQKSVSEFYFYKNRNNYGSRCKQCDNEASKLYYQKHKENYYENKKEYLKKYREEHRKENKDYQKKYRENKENKDKAKAYGKNYRELNKDKIKNSRIDYFKKYRKENKDKIYAREKEYLKNNKIYKLKKQLRGCIRGSFTRKGFTKNSTTAKIVGCDWDFLYKHLLDTFKNNYGYDYDDKEDVHIDHIIPLATVNTEEEIIKLCHYSNLQLLKKQDNLSKKDFLDWELKKDI